jgi:hypothetical protein
MHTCNMSASRGGAKLTSLIGSSLPRRRPLQVPRRQRYRVHFQFFTAVSHFRHSEFNELHDVYEYLSYLSTIVWSPHPARGVVAQPRLSIRHISAAKVASDKRTACKLQASILELSLRPLATFFPVPYQRFERPSLLVGFCQN